MADHRSGSDSQGSSRRQFLGTTAAGFAAAGLASAAGRTVFAYAPQPAAKAKPRIPLKDGETIRMGIIGTGGMGTGHCDAFSKLAKQGREKVQIVAICDVNDLHAANAKQVIEKNQGADVKIDVYRDHKKVLERQDIHGVLIAAPEHWHSRLGIDAILAGKDVYLEKPMTLRLEEAFALRDVVKANPDLILQVGTQYAAQPKYLEAKKVIESGQLGIPIWCQIAYCRNVPGGEWLYHIDPAWEPGKNLDWDTWCKPIGPQPWDPELYIRWRRYRKTSTGVIGDLLVHEMTPFFVSMNQCGWPVKVTALGSHMIDKKMENHDLVNLTVQFESGANMVVASTTNNELGFEKLIRCQKGNIYLSSRHCVIRPESKFSSEVDERTIECPDVGDDQDRHRLNWLNCMRTREQPSSDIEQGTKVMVVVALATQALWEGGSYNFDPKTMKATRS
jgi:predicted dehydrogenase